MTATLVGSPDPEPPRRVLDLRGAATMSTATGNWSSGQGTTTVWSSGAPAFASGCAKCGGINPEHCSVCRGGS